MLIKRFVEMDHTFLKDFNWTFFHKKFKVLQILKIDNNGLLSLQNNEMFFKKSNLAIHLTGQGNPDCYSGLHFKYYTLMQIIHIFHNKI